MSSRQTLAFAAALTAIPLFAGQSPARADGPLDAYLPKSGTIQGHVMRLAVAPEDQAIDRQFRNAVANNMDWFKKLRDRATSPASPCPTTRRWA